MGVTDRDDSTGIYNTALVKHKPHQWKKTEHQCTITQEII